MKRVTTVNLNGNAYQLDEDAYELLQGYLSRAEAGLAGNPDSSEILGDLERSIAEKCRRYLDERKTVITRAEVQQIVEEMGPVDGRAGEPNGAQQQESSAEATPATREPKRLYQIREGAWISGVCNGLSAYFGVDVTIVRVIFVVLAILSSGIWTLVYIALMFLIPYDTNVERMHDGGLHGHVFRFVTQTKRKFAASV